MSDAAVLQRRLERFMADQGLKQTRQRQVIFDTFVKAARHLAIDELLEQVQGHMSGVGYATVYRTMKLFVDAGVAHEINFGDGQTRYEASGAEEHHDHLICVDCGHIFEFEDGVIEQRQQEVAQQHGLRIRTHKLDIFGACLAPDNCEHRRAAMK